MTRLRKREKDLLAFLSNFGVASKGEIIRRFEWGNAYYFAAMKNLSKAGFVAVHSGDTRNYEWAITSAGREAIGQLRLL